MPIVPGTTERDVFSYFINLSKQYPKAFTFWVFNPFLPFARVNVFLNDAKLVQKVLEVDKVRSGLEVTTHIL
jgi:hypothetical protein